jgi:hypothetical protein
MKLVKGAIGALALLAAMTTKASAEICLLIVCLGGGGSPSGGDGGGQTAAPEIDVTQGFAAVAILVVALLLLRERFMRQRPQG